MVDGVKQRDRKGWKEREINYGSSGGRRGGPIKAHLPGIYNYIMMLPPPPPVNPLLVLTFSLCLQQRGESLQPVLDSLQNALLLTRPGM